KRIRYDSRAEKSRNLGLYLQLLLAVDLIHDRSRASYRLVAEIDGLHGLKSTQLMMIDDLKDFRLFNIVHRLVHFIMVHKDHFLPVHIQKITSGYGSHTFSSLIDHRKGTVAVFDHYLLDIVREVFRMESYQILGFHYEFNGNTLVDQSGNGKRIHRGRHNDDTL